MYTPLEKAVKTIIRIASPEKIILFGSRTGDNYKDSCDYDLLVLTRNIKQKRKLAQEIYLNFKNIGAPIDIIVADIEKYNELKNDPYMIYHEADKKGKVIYEQN